MYPLTDGGEPPIIIAILMKHIQSQSTAYSAAYYYGYPQTSIAVGAP